MAASSPLLLLLLDQLSGSFSQGKPKEYTLKILGEEYFTFPPPTVVFSHFLKYSLCLQLWFLFQELYKEGTGFVYKALLLPLLVE